MKNYKHTIHYALIAALLLFASACSKDDNQGTTLTAKPLTREQRLDSIIRSKTGLNPTIMVDSIEVMGTFGMKVIDTLFKIDFDTLFFGRDRNALLFTTKVGEIEPQNPNRDKYAFGVMVKRAIAIHVNDSNGLIGERRNDTVFTMNFSEYRITSRFYETLDDVDDVWFDIYDYKKRSKYYKELKNSYDSLMNVYDVHNIPYPLTNIESHDFLNYIYYPIDFAQTIIDDKAYMVNGGLMKYAWKFGGGHGDDVRTWSHLGYRGYPPKIKDFDVKTELLNDGKLHKVLYLIMPFEKYYRKIQYLRLRYVLN